MLVIVTKEAAEAAKARKARIRRARTTKVLEKILLDQKQYASEASAIGVGASAIKKLHAGSRVHMTTGQSTMDSHGKQAAAADLKLKKMKKTKTKAMQEFVLRERGQVTLIPWLS